MLLRAEVMLEVVQNVLLIWIYKENAILLISNLVLLSSLYLISLHSANLYSNCAEGFNESGHPLRLRRCRL